MKLQFDKDLDDLKHLLIDASSTVQKMIALAIRALLENDKRAADDAFVLEDKVNHMEVDIESHAITLMARRQPTAVDLRFIVSVVKMNNHLERIGDLAVNVVRMFEKISRAALSRYMDDIREISSLSSGMVADAMAAFIENDSKKARSVCERDDLVDAQHLKILKECINDIVESEIDAESGIDLVLTSKQYERIGDVATNLAEEVIFYLEGKSIKHHIENERRDNLNA
jgi:phosphate transport system protein